MTVDTNCTRCEAPLQFREPDRNPDARLLRKSAVPVGYCAACAMANWLQHTEPLSTILATKGPAMLLDRRVVDQMANVLAAGCADAKPQEIDWLSVVVHWDLPFPGDKPPSPSSRSPARSGDLAGAVRLSARSPRSMPRCAARGSTMRIRPRWPLSGITTSLPVRRSGSPV